MAKQKDATQAQNTKANTKSIKRVKRNAMERKSLPKSLKVLYMGSTKSSFKNILDAWLESRKKNKDILMG
jgi:hypothetical protein